MEYNQLALKYKPLNLGQGFPDFYAPENITKALAAATTSDNPLLNQYTRGFVSISNFKKKYTINIFQSY